MAPKNGEPVDPSQLYREVERAVDQLDRQITALRDLTDERDKRYEQRFGAQETAAQAALVAQVKAVDAALNAAKEAVNKAEVASERRFASVNEFRAQQADIIASFLPRPEYSVQHKALEDRVEVVHNELLASFSTAITNTNEKLERLRSEAVDRAEVLRHESADKIAQNFKESTGRIDALNLRMDDKTAEIDRRLLTIETKQAENVGQTTGVDRSVVVEERARTRRMQSWAAIGVGSGVIGVLVALAALLR